MSKEVEEDFLNALVRRNVEQLVGVMSALDANAPMASGMLPLAAAAEWGDERSVSIVAAKVLDPNARYNWVSAVDGRVRVGQTAIMNASCAENLSALLLEGADPHCVDANGLSVVEVLLERGLPSVVVRLLESDGFLDFLTDRVRSLVARRTELFIKELSSYLEGPRKQLALSRLNEWSRVFELLKGACLENTRSWKVPKKT